MKRRVAKAFLLVTCVLFVIPDANIRASQISGEVRTDTFIALTNVTVFIQQPYNDASRKATKTDSLGIFSFEVSDSNWSVFLDAIEINARGLVAPEARSVFASNSTNYVALVARLSDATLSGYVRDETGRGVANVIVDAPDSAGVNLFTTTTDATGFYKFALSSSFLWLPRVDPVSLSALNLFADRFFGQSFYAGENISRDIPVYRIQHTINITLVDESGAAVSGASLSASAHLGATEFDLAPPFDGNKASLALPSGIWVVTIQAPNLNILQRRFHLTNSVDAVFIAHPPPANSTVSGELIDDANQPLPGVPVTLAGLGSSTQITGANGEFAFTAPAGQCSITISNNDYLLPDTSLVTAPGSAIHKVLRARKTTSQIRIHVNGLGPQGPFLFGSATTRIGADEFNAPTSGQQDITIPVFDGEWTVSIRAVDADPVELKAIVPSPNQSFSIEVPSTISSATLTGRVINISGAPFHSYVSAVKIGGKYPPLRQTYSWQDGGFSLSVSPGEWRFGVNISPRTDALPFGTNVTELGVDLAGTYNVTNNQKLDVGALIVPIQSARVIFKLVDGDGSPLDTDNPYLNEYVLGISGNHADSTGSYSAYTSTLTNEITLDLFPGRWTFEMKDEELNKYGYAGVGAISVDLRAGDNQFPIVFGRLPASNPAPVLASSIGDDGVPRLRLFQKKCWPVDIEYSTDLHTWKFYDNAFYNHEFAPAVNANNVFYRVVRSE